MQSDAESKIAEQFPLLLFFRLGGFEQASDAAVKALILSSLGRGLQVFGTPLGPASLQLDCFRTGEAGTILEMMQWWASTRWDFWAQGGISGKPVLIAAGSEKHSIQRPCVAFSSNRSTLPNESLGIVCYCLRPIPRLHTSGE